MIKITVSASCQTGVVRKQNEDAILVSKQTLRDAETSTCVYLNADDRYVLAVCDGLGGQNAGEVASMDAVEQLSRKVEMLRPQLSSEQICEIMTSWLKEEHAYLTELGNDDPNLSTMGTTLVSLFFYEGRFYWMSCGDSRLYRMRNGILCQLSTDHSLYNVTHKETDIHVLTNCIGGGASDSFLDINDITEQVLDGDMFLLCSDGLSNMLSDEKIEQVLSITPSASALTDAAILCGGIDNVSACLTTVSLQNEL